MFNWRDQHGAGKHRKSLQGDEISEFAVYSDYGASAPKPSRLFARLFARLYGGRERRGSHEEHRKISGKTGG